MIDYSKYFDFKLKSQQVRAFQAIVDFIKSDQRVFILNGYAGTGKTTLMSGLINWLNQQRIDVVLLASTGRASKILSNKTQNKSSTVHSHIYRFQELSADLEKMSKSKSKNGQIRLVFDLKTMNSTAETIYIVDESSMISDAHEQAGSFAKFGSGDLLSDLLTYDTMGKYIFVGDPCQLPPIEQSTSPALSKDYISSKFSLSASEFELTDIIRQSDDSGIIRASFGIRELFRANPAQKWAKLPLRGFENVEFHDSHVSLIGAYIKDIRDNGFDSATLICQTNSHCHDINKIVRSALGRESQVSVGDLLMVTQNNHLSSLVNGDHVIVKAVLHREKRCGLTFVWVEIQEQFSKIRQSSFLIEEILYTKDTNLTAEQHRELMLDFYLRMKAKGIYQGDEQFNDEMLTDPYLNAIKSVFGYALTCHKCQGGEWDNVYLYLDNKIQGLPRPQIYQWWYTAVTRTKKNLHVVDDWFIS